jgi:hypothetical protein
MEVVQNEELTEATTATELPTFDPNKKYTWSTDQLFTISGSEFGIILNSLRATLSTEDAARILLAEKASLTIENALARAVENGSVVEVSEQ